MTFWKSRFIQDRQQPRPGSAARPEGPLAPGNRAVLSFRLSLPTRLGELGVIGAAQLERTQFTLERDIRRTETLIASVSRFVVEREAPGGGAKRRDRRLGGSCWGGSTRRILRVCFIKAQVCEDHLARFTSTDTEDHVIFAKTARLGVSSVVRQKPRLDVPLPLLPFPIRLREARVVKTQDFLGGPCYVQIDRHAEKRPVLRNRASYHACAFGKNDLLKTTALGG